MEPNKQKGLKKNLFEKSFDFLLRHKSLSNDKQKLRKIHDFYMHVQEPIMNGKV
jgi:hypothetical protein